MPDSPITISEHYPLSIVPSNYTYDDISRYPRMKCSDNRLSSSYGQYITESTISLWNVNFDDIKTYG